MSGNAEWVDVGAADELSQHPLQRVTVNRMPLALSCRIGDAP